MKPLAKLIATAALPLSLLLSGCSEPAPKNKAVYLLIDTSGTYTQELNKAQAILNYLLANLDSGDSIAVARIDSGSFSEKDIIAKTTFDVRPSTANDQKRQFKLAMDTFADNLKHGSANTDITGGVLQATQYLNETGAGEKYVLIFSDLEEDLPDDHVRDFPISLDNIHVVALNVTKLRSDNIDPRDYLNRLDNWQHRVVEGGGDWRVINDLERMERLIAVN
ncbi:vWA domain-containing protein [Thalassolituus marinus]|uniref:VWA domain-containing protein n=1 Tax=Thalassolituus marinus TaxID=671053 RepID=A0ABS7ZSP4_9GAMM|nr:vWA domain-containing protein [Thalassolituus marinus]MCA6064172.1 VWA domain-containing protein [Thalassolituus marinus]